MKRQNKILLASTLTVVTAFITLICLFAMNGISVQTVIALFAAAGCAYLTSCLFKIETILRRQNAKAIRRQKAVRASMAVVRRAEGKANVA